jgi:hypothetical protein
MLMCRRPFSRLAIQYGRICCTVFGRGPLIGQDGPARPSIGAAADRPAGPREIAIRFRGICLTPAAATAGAVVAYLTVGRKPCLTWGATDEEAQQLLPGDELLEAPDLISTRAITIDAPPAAIWPWLLQMGSGKGGGYTYD